MYLLSGDGIAQPWNWDWTKQPWLPLPGSGGSAPTRTEDEIIDDELKHGLSVGQLTDKIFGNRHPEFRGCSLPRSCQELRELQREWARIHAKIEGRKKNLPKL